MEDIHLEYPSEVFKALMAMSPETTVDDIHLEYQRLIKQHPAWRAGLMPCQGSQSSPAATAPGNVEPTAG